MSCGHKSTVVTSSSLNNKEWTDVKELYLDLKPELRNYDRSKLSEDTTNSLLALWWIAVMRHGQRAALRTRNAGVAVAEVTCLVISVNKGNVEWNSCKDGLKLRNGELTGETIYRQQKLLPLLLQRLFSSTAAAASSAKLVAFASSRRMICYVCHEEGWHKCVTNSFYSLSSGGKAMAIYCSPRVVRCSRKWNEGHSLLKAIDSKRPQ